MNNVILPILELLSAMEEDDAENCSSSSSSSDSDWEVENILRKCIKIPRISILNYFEDVVIAYSDSEFIRHFRIRRNLFNDLSMRYENTVEYQKMLKYNYDRVMAPDKTLAVFLWFAAHEACAYRDISDRFNISLSTVHSIILRGTAFFSNLSKEFIRWPTVEEMRVEATERAIQSGIPGVIGCLDGTHITIDPPDFNKDDYVDRKGNISIVVQAVCNKKKKFIDCFIGFPGSVHDSRVFQNSPLYAKLAALPEGYCLLGDSAYPCLLQLLPPYRDNGHLTAAHKNFNYRLSSQRIDIEHSFGILKQRFRQLYYCKLRGNKLLCHFIRACMVLHNMSDANDFEFVYDQRGTNERDRPDVAVNLQNGNERRDAICASLMDNN